MPIAQELGEKYLCLTVDPGILSRRREFLRFAKDFLKGQPSSTPFELRQAFQEHLGVMRVYRGIRLTHEELAIIQKEGLAPPAMLNNRAEIELSELWGLTQPPAFRKGMGIESKIKSHQAGGRGILQSVSKYIEVTYVAGQSWGKGDFYLFVLDIPRLSKCY